MITDKNNKISTINGDNNDDNDVNGRADIKIDINPEIILEPFTINPDKESLEKAFKSFELASVKLSNYYNSLEEKIIDLKENLNAVLESMPLGVIITNESNKITFINKYLTALISQNNLIKYLNKDINEFLYIFFEKATLEDFIKPIFNPIEKTMAISKSKSIPIFAYIKILYGKNKKFSGRIFIFQNIEEIKKTKRLAEIGEMSAKIAHEIRNPLGSVELFASILSTELKDEKHKEIISYIISAVKNMNTTITNLLEFSKNIKPDISKQNLYDICNNSILFASYIVKQKNITVDENIDRDLFINGDKNLLTQSFLNIIINACQSVPENNGIININSTIIKNDSNDTDYICITFKDNGKGFEKENMDKIFTPFFSTKKSGGTGLGLSIALNNAILHGGYINAENSADGAKISVYLPM
ncbi:MAG: hypothetical protein EVG15_05095 [Candidatus Acididesulfobacter diazotrophicus]|jgi:signal transduction histidine kinase|uniref:histidine kinase n=1 Tax=Candidatus Acididesulfobacter diazotrophicus TaxID=2597226 RepID=A0A519BMS7_9DELT|nr:MAG: hypothetical protein EVG15_05095 [Candidatus Acididesulfobacter diazotrophicus]